MSERLANRLKIACRIMFVLGNLALVWLFFLIRDAERAEDLPFALSQVVWLVLLAALAIGVSLLLGTYMSFAMGVDVFGLNRFSHFPRGKPFDGLAPGEEKRLHLPWTRGAFGRGANAGFKLLLTNRRLLAGSSLTSWYLLEIPLETIRLVEKKDRRWGSSALRFHVVGAADYHREISLGRESERVRLEEELSRLGIAVIEEDRAPS